MTDLPAEVKFGMVVARFLLGVGDTDDPGSMPDALPASGSVKFLPRNPNSKVSVPTPALVTARPPICQLDANGDLVDAMGNPGVWLVVGDYDVTFAIKGVRIAPLTITVTEAHTALAPLVLTLQVPPGGPAVNPSQYAELSARVDTKVAKGADVVNVKDYGAVGNGIADDTDAFNNALLTGRAVVAPKGVYIIDPVKNAAVQTPYRAGIRMTVAGSRLILEDGAQLLCKPVADTRYSMIEMIAADCSVSGGKITGDLTTHLGSTGEWGYCIQVNPSADRALIEDVDLADAWGDCVLIGDTDSYTTGVQVKDVTIRGCTMDRARRNNLSVIACKDLTVTGCSFTRAGTVSGTFPKCGVDLEPNPGGLQDIVNAVFMDCTMADNVAAGFLIQAQGRTAQATVIGCTSRNNGTHGFVFTSTVEAELSDCLARSNGGIGFTGDSFSGKSVIFSGCRALANASVGFACSAGMQGIACYAEDNVGGGFLASSSGKYSGCIGRGNNPTAGSQYYGNFSAEGGAGAVFSNCHSDAGVNATKPNYGFRILGGTTGTQLFGCSAVGTYPSAAYLGQADTVASPVPGKPIGYAGATTTTTAPTAGGAGALPATPLGYMTIAINGTDRKIPYYA